MTEKACKLHTNSLIISTEAEVIQPKGWEVGCGGGRSRSDCICGGSSSIIW
jgi:hypothetical protein